MVARCSDGPLIAIYCRLCLQNLFGCLIMGFFSYKYNLTFMLVILGKTLFRCSQSGSRWNSVISTPIKMKLESSTTLQPASPSHVPRLPDLLPSPEGASSPSPLLPPRSSPPFALAAAADARSTDAPVPASDSLPTNPHPLPSTMTSDLAAAAVG